MFPKTFKMAFCLAALPAALAAKKAEQVPLPVAAHAPTTLCLIDRKTCEEDWLATLASLQGLIARNGGERQLYLTQADSGQSLWPKELARVHGLRLEAAKNPYALLKEFARAAKGYVLFDAGNPASVNVASAAAARLDAVMLERARERAGRDAGLTCLGDGTNPGNVPSPRISEEPTLAGALAEQSGERLWGLRDYLQAARLPNLGEAELESLAAGSDRPIFGWGDASRGEDRFIARNSRLGLFTIPTDHASNLSVLSAFRSASEFRQKPEEGPKAVAERGVHIVSFVLTDGDNAGWVLGDFATNRRWFGSPARGRVPMGYGLPPSLVELAPDALSWFYAQAARGERGSDGFTVGPSGAGYFFPSLYPPEALRQHVARLHGLMRRADLRIVQILDRGALDRRDLWTCYLDDPQVDGLIYLDYDPYNKEQGRIVWAAGKPVVSVRRLLWKNQRGADAASLVRALNAARRDLSSPDGYTIVAVHAWTQTLADVEALAARLDAQVRVVTPAVFFATVRANLRPDPQ